MRKWWTQVVNALVEKRYIRVSEQILYLLFLLFLSFPVYAFEGFLEPFSEVDIVASETGVITSIEVSEGDRVQQGDILVELDNAVLNASLSIADARKNSLAEVKAAETEFVAQRKRFEQFKKLYAEQVVSADELERAESEFIITESRFKSAQNQHKIYQHEHERIVEQIERRRIKSPINGIVTMLNRDEGELVAMSHGPFIKVVDVSKLRFVSHIPYQQVASLNVGNTLFIELEGNTEPHSASIKFISPVVDPASATVKVELVIDNESGLIQSGVPAKIVFSDESTNDLLLGDNTDFSTELSQELLP